MTVTCNVTITLVPAGSDFKEPRGQEWQPHVRPKAGATLMHPAGWRVATRQWRMARLPGRCVSAMTTAVNGPLTSK